nr:hypothetical protein Iba_chr04aCG14190 [Ipomoea batatas]
MRRRKGHVINGNPKIDGRPIESKLVDSWGDSLEARLKSPLEKGNRAKRQEKKAQAKGEHFIYDDITSESRITSDFILISLRKVGNTFTGALTSDGLEEVTPSLSPIYSRPMLTPSLAAQRRIRENEEGMKKAVVRAAGRNDDGDGVGSLAYGAADSEKIESSGDRIGGE